LEEKVLIAHVISESQGKVLVQQVLPSVRRFLSSARLVGVVGTMVYLCHATSAEAIVIKNLAPSGTALLGVASDLLGSDDHIIDHQGPLSELNDGVLSQNLAANAFTINADGQNGEAGNGADTFAPNFAAHIFDFAGVMFARPQHGISSIRFQNYIANDGGWWGPTQTTHGGTPLGLVDLVSPVVQVTFNGGGSWTTVPSLTTNYRPLYAGVVRGTGFPNATAGPLATITFQEQFGIDGIRLIGESAGPADGSGFIGVTEFEAYGIAPELSLEVNSVSGRVRLVNDSLSRIELDFYRIDSPSGSLDITDGGWNSLDTPNLNPADFPAGSGNGDGWERMANLSSKLVAESFLQGSSSLQPGEFVSLGDLFSGATPDLSLRYRTSNGAFIEIAATYVSTPPLSADFNDDDFVNAADYIAWQNAYGLSNEADADGDGDTDGRDFLVWQREFGATSAGSLQTIPEPSTSLLTISLLGLQGALRRGQLS
jgi:hypothetical protein